MYALQGTAASATWEVEQVSNEKSPPAAVRFTPGLLVEFSGPGARDEAAKVLSRYPTAPAAWIEQNLHPFPDDLRRYPLNWDKLLFIDGGKDSAWSLSSLLRSGEFPLIVYYAPYGNERTLRRIRKLAKRSKSMVILLSEAPYPIWQIHCQYSTMNGKLELLRGSHS